MPLLYGLTWKGTKALRNRNAGEGNGNQPEQRRGGKARSLGQLLPGLTKPILGKQGAALADILLEWPLIAGEALAGICRPDRLVFPRGRRNGGTLHLRVVSAAALELQHESPRLIERVNRYFGYAAVDRLRLVHAPLGPESTRPRKTRAGRATRAVSPAERAELRRRVAGVEDPELRETLERLGAAVLAEAREPAEK